MVVYKMAIWYKQLSSALYQDAFLMSSLLYGDLDALRNPDKQTYNALKALLGHTYDVGLGKYILVIVQSYCYTHVSFAKCKVI